MVLNYNTLQPESSPQFRQHYCTVSQKMHQLGNGIAENYKD